VKIKDEKLCFFSVNNEFFFVAIAQKHCFWGTPQTKWGKNVSSFRWKQRA